MRKTSFFRENRIFCSEGKVYSSLFSIPNLKISGSSIEAFLKLGYVPGKNTLFEGVTCTSFDVDEKVGLEELFSQLPDNQPSPEELKKIFLESISELYNSSPDNIVPLSGGMDSRIILAALCELTESCNVHTYTFGMPGSYDYEIPNRIAHHFGTKHTNFRAEDTKYTVEGLIRAAIASDGNTEVFHPLVLNRVADHYKDDSVYWSGFAGDLVGGAFGGKLSGQEPKQQLIDYEKRGTYFLDDVVSDQALYPYITSGKKMDGYVSESEACFWENHVERYTGHHIFRNDMQIHAPLVDMHFLKFFFSLSDDKREGKRYFNKVFYEMFPDFFAFPTKDYGYKYSKNYYLTPLHKARFYFSSLGWRVAPNIFTHPNTAYIDMHHAINNRDDVRSCVDELLEDLAKRSLVDNSRMFRFLDEHRCGRKVYTKDIINLASLEVILKAADQ